MKNIMYKAQSHTYVCMIVFVAQDPYECVYEKLIGRVDLLEEKST